MDSEVLTEVPINLRKLVQMVVRGFYTVEDMLIVDMLVRNLCLSEDNICDLLKFDRKMLRQRINTLKADKLLQSRMKMITQEDGKAQREQYYFINYKSFVNVVKYKLDHIRKKLETEEREQTSRASFVCYHCQRSYTDLEADQLLDIATGQLVCIICRTEVQEDMSGMPKHDSRILLTRFNEQLEPLFTLLKEVENIKLSAEFSDPNPQDSTNGKKSNNQKNSKGGSDSSRAWSGDASKRQGFQVEGSVDVNISTEQQEETQKAKEEPAWLSQAASFITTKITKSQDDPTEVVDPPKSTVGSGGAAKPATDSKPKEGAVDEVLMLLQAHEPKRNNNSKRPAEDSDSDNSVEEQPPPNKKQTILAPFTYNEDSLEGMLDSDDDDGKDDGEGVPLISVGSERIAITAVDNTVIARMTQQEKNLYINAYQEYMAGMDD